MSLSSKLKKARLAWELGHMLMCAIERGRELHPWISTEHSFRALRQETKELMREVYLRPKDDESRPQRIRDEALDCAVVAIRIMLGY